MAHAANFAKTMLRLAQERDSLNIINDRSAHPRRDLLADITAHAIRTTSSSLNYPACIIWSLPAKHHGTAMLAW